MPSVGSPTSPQRRTAVIGGGYAGMAAAVRLCAAGQPADVFEAGRVLGGRARRITLDDIPADNGQHILSGAYTELLDLLRVIGVAEHSVLQRMPLHLEIPGCIRLKAWPLPAPLHAVGALLGAGGLGVRDRLSLIRLMRSLDDPSQRPSPQATVTQWLARHRQPVRVVRYLWEPLCLAALNTPLEQASAQVFARVLKDALGAGRRASELLFPVVDLTRLFPDPAQAFVERHGGRVLAGTRIRGLQARAGRFELSWHGGAGHYDRVIVATAPHHAARLLDGVPGLAALAGRLTAMPTEPITTVYLRYPTPLRLHAPMLGMTEGPGQWLFDRGALGGPAGLLAAVISASGPHQNLSRDALADAIHAQIARDRPGLPTPTGSYVITDKHATFACHPELWRPDALTPMHGLYLCGDYTAGDYPATLEAAVRSGSRAARLAMATPPAPDV